ncbi:DUF262 domain-containing protein [Vibrio mimicus]
MEKKIKDIFNAESLSILSALGKPGTAYQIPSYQRKYSWKKDNIRRLIEDVVYGIKDIKNDPNGLSFLGTFIVTPLTSSSETPSEPLSIVDGQQRLTTIALIIASLHEKIRIGSLDGTLSSKIKDSDKEVKRTLKQLRSCLFDDRGISDDAYDLQPVIIRDSDKWGDDQFSSYYISSIANLLHNYAKHLHQEIEDEFYFNLNSDNENDSEVSDLNERLKLISSTLSEIYDSNCEYDGLYLGEFECLLDYSIKRNLLSFIEDITNLDFDSLNEKEISTVYLIIFSKYLIDKVVLTKVVASEKYAFDVFESLNTTGEPLTALETFKPKLIQLINDVHNNDNAYNKSNSKKYLDNVERYIESLGEKQKQNSTQDIVNSFALLYSGEKLGNNLSAQRNYLRSLINLHKDESEVENIASKLSDLVAFKNAIWTTEELDSQMKNLSDRDITLTCCEFLRTAKKTLCIPILARYYIKAKVNSDFSEFSNIVKAITAFTMLWRSALGGTAGIDDAYREIMYFGYKKKKKVVAEEINNPICYKNNNPPTADELIIILHNHLKSKELFSFDDWYKNAKTTNIYNASGPIAKMFILMANHKSTFSSEDQILYKGARNNVREYLNLDVWNSRRSFSIEHIAPQNRNSYSTWDDSIYKEVHTVNTIGNLTLLPQKENDAVANSNWDIKKIYFNCFVQRDNKELEAAIEQAKKKGLQIPKKVVQELMIGDYLDIIEPIVNQENWLLEDIEKRTKNLCELLWKECDTWLKLSN